MEGHRRYAADGRGPFLRVRKLSSRGRTRTSSCTARAIGARGGCGLLIFHDLGFRLTALGALKGALVVIGFVRLNAFEPHRFPTGRASWVMRNINLRRDSFAQAHGHSPWLQAGARQRLSVTDAWGRAVVGNGAFVRLLFSCVYVI